MKKLAVLVILVLSSLLGSSANSSDEQCGWQAGNATCPDDLCCSKWGYCGSTLDYCGDGCQSQCRGVWSVISEAEFDEMLPHRNLCGTENFYTYGVFNYSTESFDGFGTTGSNTIRKREIAAFLAQTSYRNRGYVRNATGAYVHAAYCFTQKDPDTFRYCSPSELWPCAPGQNYNPRGAFLIDYNYNYGPAGKSKEINVDLLNYPYLVTRYPTYAFKTALWLWMTPNSTKPTPHDVITGKWTPSSSDEAAGRLPGYGVITNILDGDTDCGRGFDTDPLRIEFYKRYCDILGVSYGENLDCINQSPFDPSSIAAV